MDRVSSRIRKTVPVRNGQRSGLCRLPEILFEKEGGASYLTENRNGKDAGIVNNFRIQEIYFCGSSGVGSNPSTSRGTLPVYSPESN